MKIKYKFLGSIVAITCMTSAVAISITNCGPTNNDDFVWTGKINKEWTNGNAVANNQFATTVQSTPADYTAGIYTDTATDDNMIKNVSNVLRTTGTKDEQQQAWCGAFLTSILSGFMETPADYQFDSSPGGDVSNYNENWTNFIEESFSYMPDFDSFKIQLSFDLTLVPDSPAALNNLHMRMSLPYEGATDTLDFIQLIPNAEMCWVENLWDGISNTDGMVNRIEIDFGDNTNTKQYFHVDTYKDGEFSDGLDIPYLSMCFLESFPIFYGSTFPRQ